MVKKRGLGSQNKILFSANYKSKLNSNSKSNSNKFAIGFLVAIVSLLIFGIAFSLINTKLTTEKITGAAVGTGNLSLTITGMAGITVSGNFSLGTGYVNGSCAFAVINTTGGVVNNGCWLNGAGEIPLESALTGWHTIENTGTSVVALTMDTATADSESFICGGANGCTASTTAAVNITAIGSTVAGLSCASDNLPGNAALLNSTGNNSISLCTIMSYADDYDDINVSFLLVVPSDAPSSTESRVLTVIYTGTG